MNNYDNKNDLAFYIVTGVPLLVLVLRNFSLFTVDNYTIYLLLIAMTPSIAPWIKTVELSGVGKMDFNGMRDAARQAGILENSENTDLLSKVKSIAHRESDTKGELVKMWVGIADNLSNIATLHNVPQQKDVSSTIDSLREKKLISESHQTLLLGISKIFNGVLKGRKIDKRIAEFALNVGPQLSAALQQLAMPADNQSKE